MKYIAAVVTRSGILDVRSGPRAIRVERGFLQLFWCTVVLVIELGVVICDGFSARRPWNSVSYWRALGHRLSSIGVHWVPTALPWCATAAGKFDPTISFYCLRRNKRRN